MKQIMILLALAFLLGGCASMPYKSNFSCPQAEKGTCGPVKDIYKTALYGQNDDNINFSSEDVTELIKKLRRCASSDDRKCVRETEDELRKKFESAVKTGEKRARLDMAAKIESFRLKATTVPLDEELQIKPVIMKIIFAKYKTKEGLLVGEHAVYKVVSYGDWVVEVSDNISQKMRVGSVY